MAKRVVVISSGETERRSLPHLVAHLAVEGVSVVEVRIPPGNKLLNVEMAAKLVRATWFERAAAPPDKFVILVDSDGHDPDEVLRPFREQLPKRLAANVPATIVYAYAQWHLEAWYFADAKALRSYLRRDLGHADASQPDAIVDPKRHLRNLLGDRVYTAVVSEEIAELVSAEDAATRSPSLAGFLNAVRNGPSAATGGN